MRLASSQFVGFCFSVSLLSAVDSPRPPGRATKQVVKGSPANKRLKKSKQNRISVLSFSLTADLPVNSDIARSLGVGGHARWPRRQHIGRDAIEGLQAHKKVLPG